jgi:hypothetical protein
MRRLVVLAVLTLAACTEAGNTLAPPMDRFFYPSGLALTPTASGNQALLVASANFDLHYAFDSGATVLSVDPRPASEGGSARPGGGALVKHGAGARISSFTGPLAVADATTCPGDLANPGFGTATHPATALITSRYANRLYLLPIGADGAVEPCGGPECSLPLDPRLLDAGSVTVTCRADGARRTAWISYLRAPQLTTATGGVVSPGTAWLSEVDLENPAGAMRTIPLAFGAVADAAYDAASDRLFAVGGSSTFTAPVFVLNLRPCRPGDATCPAPGFVATDLYGSLRGSDLTSIALSNQQAGRGRRAYVTARVYDADIALAGGYRPASDIAGVLMVLDIEENGGGRPALRLLSVVEVGLGPGKVAVLPPRPVHADGTPRGDLVVITNSVDGVVTVYDDDLGAVVRVLPLDERTGRPEAGRVPYALVVDPHLRGTGAEVFVRAYVASFRQDMLSLVDVPLLNPGAAAIYKEGGQPAVIGTVTP